MSCAKLLHEFHQFFTMDYTISVTNDVKSRHRRAAAPDSFYYVRDKSD